MTVMANAVPVNSTTQPAKKAAAVTEAVENAQADVPQAAPAAPKVSEMFDGTIRVDY